jgi:3-hydroxyacyl-[acyl-carrier-protein] dehydratase
MSILNGFYTLNSCQQSDGDSYTALVTLNKSHDIFRGHFPGNPVAPGVCMMQIVKDISEKILERKLFLTAANNVKFMAIINPEETPELSLELEFKEEADAVRVKNITSFGGTIALKMSVHYKKI